MKKFIAILVLVLFILAGAILMLLQTDFAKEYSEKMINDAVQKSGYQVSWDKIEGKFPYAIDLKNLSIESDAFSLKVDTIETRLNLLGLLRNQLLFSDVKGSGIVWQEKEGAATFGKGAPISVKVDHFLFTDVHVDEMVLNLEGSFRLGQKNRSLYLDVTAIRPEFPNSNGHFIVHLDKNGLIQLKGSLQTPTLTVLPVEIPFDAAADIRFAMRGKKEHLIGKLFGTVTPKSLELGPLNPYLENEWDVSSRISFDHEGWKLTNIAATSGKNSLGGDIELLPKGDFQSAHLKIKWDDFFAKAVLMPQENGTAVVLDANFAQYKLIHNINAHTEFLYANQSLSGKGNGDFSFHEKPWRANGDFSWVFSGPVEFTRLQIEGSTVEAKGRLEIRPNQILAGETEFTIGNLHELNDDIYGSANGKIDWLISQGKQVVTVDAEATGFYWKDLFAEKLLIDTSLIDPFETPQGRITIDSSDVKWHELFLDRIRFETLLSGVEWPFTIGAFGKWSHPLVLNTSGLWNYKDSTLKVTCNSAEGSFYYHPITLQKPAKFSYGPDHFLVDGLDLAVSNARATFDAKRDFDDAAISLVLEHFPLDMLSLNPLDVKIEGEIDCSLSLQEKKGSVTGEILANVQHVEVASQEEEMPQSIKGSLQGDLKNERLNLTASILPLVKFDLSLPVQISLISPKWHLLFAEDVKGNLELRGKVEEILDFFDLGPHRIEGDILCELSLKNTLQNPKTHGKCSLENGYYENYITGTKLTSMKASAKADQDKLILETLSAKDNGGSVEATGEIHLLVQDALPYHFDITITDFKVSQIDLVTAEANGKVRLEGDLLGGVAKGNIDIIESDLHIPEKLPRKFPNLTVVYRNPTKPMKGSEIDEKFPYPLTLDLSVRAPEKILIEGRGLTSEWKGDFHLGGTYTSIAAQGKLELIKGEFQFSNRHFKLTDGTLSFSGKEKEMPYLNLGAEITIKDTLISARIKGPLNNPQLTFQSNPPLPLSTIMSYLLFGQELAEINSFQALQLANSLASFAGAGPDVLEKTRKALGVDRLNIVTVPSGKDELEETIALQVGKYVAEGVLVSVTQTAEDASADINIEIDVGGGWIVQLESDQRQEQGKLTVKWTHNM